MVAGERDAGVPRAPWASGPGEILGHGLSLLKKDADANRRLAMLSIDNAVELMLKTYLGLPSRITGKTVTRRDYQEACMSFPALLDAIEHHAPEKLRGVNLAEIEWFHRLRNELYHQGKWPHRREDQGRGICRARETPVYQPVRHRPGD